MSFNVFHWTLSLFSINLNVRRYHFGVWRLLSVGMCLCPVWLKFTDFWRHLLPPSLRLRQQVHPKRPFGLLNFRKNMDSQTWSFTFLDINCCFTFFRTTSSVLLNTVSLSESSIDVYSTQQLSFYSIKIVNVVKIGDRRRSLKIRKVLRLSGTYFFYCSQSTGFRQPNEQSSVVVMCLYKYNGIPNNMHSSDSA